MPQGVFALKRALIQRAARSSKGDATESVSIAESSAELPPSLSLLAAPSTAPATDEELEVQARIIATKAIMAQRGIALAIMFRIFLDIVLSIKIGL